MGPSKRRKGGAGSITGSATSSAHPLRQTSFPPEEGQDNGLRSPSVESDVTGVTGGQSAVTAGGGVGKKRRGRGKKGKEREGTGSVRSGGRIVDGQPRGSGGSHAAAEDEEEEDDDDALDGGEPGEESSIDKAAERKNISVLVDAFNDDQEARYTMYRRIKLKKETVRKISNYVVSQSVPPSVILTINGYTKTFIGGVIERAREVQEQWAREGREVSDGQAKGRIEVDPTDFGGENKGNVPTSVFGDGRPVDPARLVVGQGSNGASNGTPKEGEGAKNLGPLQPDHLREALRRYRRDGEGGGTGLAGVSVGLGIPGTGAARLQGKRLFK